MKIALQDLAYQKCSELVHQGVLVPGEMHSESAISKQLGISRTPIRTAIQRLEKEGVVTRLPQRGFYINEFDEKDIEELFAIRKAIEGFAVESLAKRAAAVDLAIYDRHLTAQEAVCESEDLRPFVEADRKFHVDIVSSMGNQRLIEIYADLRQSIALIAMRRFRVTSQRDQSLTDHKAIVKAIRQGDSIAAREAVYHHLDSAMELLKKQAF